MAVTDARDTVWYGLCLLVVLRTDIISPCELESLHIPIPGVEDEPYRSDEAAHELRLSVGAAVWL